MSNEQNQSRMGLLVVDVQNGVIQSFYKKEQVVENIRLMLSKARAASVPIIWVQHSSEELIKDTNEWKIEASLTPGMDDYFIEKFFNSAYERTTLNALIKQLDLSKIVLVGAATNWCIRATVYATLERGYDLCLISDAHTTESLDYGNGHVIEAKDIILELNTTVKWLEYPDRVNEIKSAEAFEFI